MTVRMQESEIAGDLSRFLAYLEAGDQVEVAREGKATLLTCASSLEEPLPGPPRGSLKAAQAFFTTWGALLADEEYVRSMREAREVFNQPLEPRPEWD